MTDLDDLPFAHDDGRLPNGATGRKPCSRHTWQLVIEDGTPFTVCARCGKPADPERRRRGKAARRLGGDQERRIERLYGPTKIGERGDPVDHLGRDFKWQAKSSRSAPPRWLARITEPTWRPLLPMSILRPMARMTGIGGTRRPLVIRSYVHQGTSTRDWLFMSAADWARLHGGDWPYGYIVVPGWSFLAIHGRDELHGPVR